MIHTPRPGGRNDAQDLREAWVHSRPIEGGATLLTRGLDELGRLRAGGVRVVEIPVVPGDPVRRGDDVDTALELDDQRSRGDELISELVKDPEIQRKLVKKIMEMGLGDKLLKGIG